MGIVSLEKRGFTVVHAVLVKQEVQVAFLTNHKYIKALG